MARPQTGASLALNKGGVYEIRWSENRRTHRLSTRTENLQAAQRFLAGWLMERERDETAKAVVSCKYVLDLYLDEHIEHGPVVDKTRARNAIKNLREFFNDIPCCDIDLSHCKEYSKLRRAGLTGSRPAKKDGTLRRELSSLTAAMNYAVRSKKMSLADVSFIHLPAKGEPREMWLMEDEREAMLAAADREDQAMMLFVYLGHFTASRRAAIERLEWEYVDLQARMIRYDLLPGPKTRKRRVAVPISDRLYLKLAAAKLASTSTYVLGQDHEIHHRFNTFMRKLAAETGNKRFLKVTPHTMRHTWATLAARAGFSMYKIAGVLGDSVSTVEKNYLKHAPDHLRDAVNF